MLVVALNLLAIEAIVEKHSTQKLISSATWVVMITIFKNVFSALGLLKLITECIFLHIMTIIRINPGLNAKYVRNNFLLDMTWKSILRIPMKKLKADISVKSVRLEVIRVYI